MFIIIRDKLKSKNLAIDQIKVLLIFYNSLKLHDIILYVIRKIVYT